MLATACAATPSIVATTDSATAGVSETAAAPITAASATAASTVLSEDEMLYGPGGVPAPEDVPNAIDFTLRRGDIDCHPAGTTRLTNTRVVSVHYVVSGNLAARCYGRTNAALVDAWKVLASLTPPDHADHVGVFVAYTNTLETKPESSIVGIASSMGWYANDAQISVDIDYAFNDEDELASTLVHEMGHVLANSRSQTIAPTEPCTGLVIRRVCYRADSFFVEWVALFWGNDMLAQVDETATPTFEAGIARCEANPGFMNSYAASSPSEDFAESYSAFVLDVAVENADQQARLDWFASKPAFAAARDHARASGHNYQPRIVGPCR